MFNHKITNIGSGKFVKSVNGNIGNMKHNEDKSDSLISGLRETAPSFDSFTAANSYFDELCKNNPDFVKLDSNQYKYKDYYINTGFSIAFQKHVQGLTIANNLKLSCAPQLVDYITTKNDKHVVLITKVDGTENGNVVPFNECRSEVSVEAKNNFMKDIDTFTQVGYTNRAIDKPSNWFVVPSTKQIIIGNWSDFSPLLTEQDKVQYKKDISGTLGLIY